MPEKRYYVVTWTKNYGIPDPDLPDPEDDIWTISTDPKETGWETDCGCEGYGLTKAEAQFLCDAANEKLARDC